MESLIDFIFNTTGWLIVAVLLIALEFLAPGIFFMWLGFAAIVMSILTLGIEFSWQVQLIIFSLLGVGFAYIGKTYVKKKPIISDDTTLNRRGSQYIGKVCEVVEPFKNGRGKVKVEDTLWSATGPKTLAVGTSVKIVAIDGTRLKVEAEK